MSVDDQKGQNEEEEKDIEEVEIENLEQLEAVDLDLTSNLSAALAELISEQDLNLVDVDQQVNVELQHLIRDGISVPQDFEAVNAGKADDEDPFTR